LPSSGENESGHLRASAYGGHDARGARAWLGKIKRVTLYFTLTSGSWPSLVGIFFGIISRQAFRRGAFLRLGRVCRPLILLAPSRQDERARQHRPPGRRPYQAGTEYLARELASVRLALKDVVTSQDLSRAAGAPREADRRCSL
jgi:hypothetical protein